mgnify:CR=1 FL=1
MAKLPASPAAVESVRERIILEAASLINEVGYADFSMRKLGARLGVAAKTIYNYFTDRDELYLKVVTKGFEMLYDRFSEARASHDAPFMRLDAMARAYVSFGFGNPHLYSIMFSLGTPKYADYVGKKHEALAAHQNAVALESAVLARELLEKVMKTSRRSRGDDPDYRLMQLWSALHGIVSLSLSRVTLEVGDFTGAIDRMVDELLEWYRP